MTRSKAVVLLVAGALLAPVAVRAQDEGLKQVDRLIKVSGETVQSIAEAKLQLERTVTGYNAILAEQAKDRRGAYKDLIKDKDNTQTKVEAVRQRVAGMEQEANTLFAAWAKNVEGITEEGLRKKSQARLDDTKKRFGDILSAGKQAREAYDPFMKQLADQITYMGHDLNPEAVASLKPDAAKLNDQATKVFARVDETMKVAREYINSLRP